MKIVAVCGMGIGTSVLLKMNTEKALRTMGVDADVEATDISAARGAMSGADLILTSAELAEELGDTPVKVVVIDNFFDVTEINRKLNDAIDT